MVVVSTPEFRQQLIDDYQGALIRLATLRAETAAVTFGDSVHNRESKPSAYLRTARDVFPGECFYEAVRVHGVNAGSLIEHAQRHRGIKVIRVDLDAAVRVASRRCPPDW
jgi:hypothetical protein